MSSFSISVLIFPPLSRSTIHLFFFEKYIIIQKSYLQSELNKRFIEMLFVICRFHFSYDNDTITFKLGFKRIELNSRGKNLREIGKMKLRIKN